ncbi:hypothetical protein ASALC70_03685 [Alcanivorax sp. ALC70]|nr:hypothetical protein ASALC70_03685 [Alcanivorax sp. ALC70]
MVRRLMYELEPDELAGTVVGVPIVNLDGFRNGSRYLSDRRDLNRYFPGRKSGSAASRVAYSLFENIVRHCDYLVDLHTGSQKRINQPQLRADLEDPRVVAFAKHFGGMTVLHSPPADGMLRAAAVDEGIVAVTMEAGGPNRLEEEAVDYGVQALETLLENLDMRKASRFWGRRSRCSTSRNGFAPARAGFCSPRWNSTSRSARVRFSAPSPTRSATPAAPSSPPTTAGCWAWR